MLIILDNFNMIERNIYLIWKLIYEVIFNVFYNKIKVRVLNIVNGLFVKVFIINVKFFLRLGCDNYVVF